MRALFLLFTLSICISSQAQSLNGWLIYFGNTQIKDSKFSLHHELQLRDYKIIGDHNQTLIRIGGQYQFKPYFQATLGYGFIHTEAEGTPNNPFAEHRIYQEGMFSHGILNSKLRHRIRLEERFIENQDFRGRFRYCLFADIPLNAKQFDKNGLYLALYDEIFLNISDEESIKAFDRNRAYSGLGYKLQQNLGLQLGYMRQHVGSNAGTNHLMLSVHHKMN
ncbi:DUF2490 domain-containing protein [Sphingobacterium composti Ten et al. 2007 non Yoo et al. 2007]|uniref:DUF2490 domain-containing protein n=1 Tax=Sphingobacterium composti TaxID=363260 RepID=UPI001357BE8E|nr:DUF2490 domain-containing protein [Sphingobacterium composti Ten et al. 2007 non Yoo et al. 2007]